MEFQKPALHWNVYDRVGVVAKSPTLADRVAARTEEGLDEVVRKIVEVLGPPRAPSVPRVGTPPRPTSAPTPPRPPTADPPKTDGPIKVIGVEQRGIGKPRNDGTRGSALYRVPLKLSRTPSSDWARQSQRDSGSSHRPPRVEHGRGAATS